MFFQTLLFACALPLARTETVLGVYIFSRHGDRTAKATPPANLTDLGFQEVFTSGTFFRNRYISSDATSQIYGIEPNLVALSQLAVSAPVDNVLQSSAIGFLTGLYPPVGPTLGSTTLRNGTVVQAPLGGFQLIPVEIVSGGSGSEDSAWLQGATGCAGATTSSNEYFYTSDYNNLLNSTMNFYQNLLPMINGTFSGSAASFKNAYTIFDLLNVASIHNTTNFNDPSLLTQETFFQLRTLADHHEFELAYNASTPIRAVAGSVLAAQIVQALNTTLTGKHNPRLNIQFGAYGSFQSFFGLANLTTANPDFYGIPDYASTMTFELVTNSSVNPFPAASDVSVRFLFHNGTTSNISTPVAYPLFGQQSALLSWSDFVDGMNSFAIGNQSDWCTACGNSTGICASSSSTSGSGNDTGSGNGGTDCGDSSSSGGMSNAVAGVIGAMVTLAVILLVEGLIMLAAGLRLVSKRRSTGPAATGTQGVKA